MDESTKEQAARWLRQVLDHTGWTAAQLAREAGLSPSTITRGMSPESKFVPTLPTLQAVARAAKLPTPPGLDPSRAGASALAGPDIVLMDADSRWCGAAISKSQTVARVNSRVLDLAGLLPGDEILLDREPDPQAGDIVCVAVYNLDRGNAETMIRRYDPPYVTTETTDPLARGRPLLVDNERTKILSVMIRMSRSRHGEER